MTVLENDPTRNGHHPLTTFYFREFIYGQQPQHNDVLSSFNGSPKALREWLGGRSPQLTVAVFDHTTTPPTLVYRAKGVKFSFKDARQLRDDFPQFYIGEHGDLWDSDSFSSVPVMPGPGRGLLDFIAEANAKP